MGNLNCELKLGRGAAVVVMVVKELGEDDLEVVISWLDEQQLQVFLLKKDRKVRDRGVWWMIGHRQIDESR